MKKGVGFTLIEVIMVVALIGILAAVAIFGYGSLQRTGADRTVQIEVTAALTSLNKYYATTTTYPPNLAGAQYAPPATVALTLYTNAPSIGVYAAGTLNADQNAQLFLNVCNANLEGTNSTACVFNGSDPSAKIHVKGTNSTNTIWNSPLSQSNVTLSCGTACDTATANMISQFLAQGGTFDISISGDSVSLPTPTQVANGPATRFCLQAYSASFPSISYYVLSDNKQLVAGTCPEDPTLHYYP